MPTRRAASPGEAAIHEALTFAKRHAGRMEGVHGVDFGFAYVDGERTEQRSIRFHVRRKRPSAELPASQLLPGEVRGFPVDVVESGYRPHAGDPRTQQAGLSPGISVGNLATGQTGTLGALVQGAKGETYILSNWHVLAGAPEARPGDQIVQPGPMHLGPNAAHPVAALDRTLATDEQLDAGLARVADGVEVDQRLFNLTFAARRVAAPSLGARLIKSGAVSGVTEAVVDGVGGTYQLDYSNFGLGMLWMRGFRLVKGAHGEAAAISEPGDSGSIWVDAKRRAAIGLHFGGEDDASPLNDYALAHPLGEVLQRLNVSLLV